MQKITSKRCIALIKKKFPKFSIYWDDYIKNFGSGLGLHIQMIPFGEYAIDTIKSNNDVEIKQIFDFVEFLCCNSNELVQSAITTGFLEYLMNNDPDKIQFSNFVKHLGENAINYCRAWDEFTGVRTKGLWENEKNNK